MTTVVPFAYADQQVRVITDEHGEPWFVATDVAAVLDLGNVRSSLALLDDDERGVHTVDTPGGQQLATTVNESGLYSLVLRSRKAEAKAFKRWITHEVLPQIRRTGAYVAPLTDGQRALALAHEVIALHGKVAELQPAAHAWGVLAASEGDYSLREAAQILTRDPAIDTGQNRLARTLRELGMCDHNGRPYQRHAAHLRLRARSYEHPRTGEQQLTSQIRVTAQGVQYLHRRLGGVQPVLMAVSA